MFIIEKKKPREIREEVNKALGDQNISKAARDNAIIVAGETLTQI